MVWELTQREWCRGTSEPVVVFFFLMAFLSLIARGIPICCPPGIDFKVVMRLPLTTGWRHPVLHFFAPHLPTCSPHREKIYFRCSHLHLMASRSGLGHGMLNVCTGFAESQVEGQACLCEAKCPSGVAALVLSVTQAEVRSPGWGRPRSGLKKERELCALFSAIRAESCLGVSTSCFLIHSCSQTCLIPGYPAPRLPPWAAWKLRLILLHFHAPSFACTWRFLTSFGTYTK